MSNNLPHHQGPQIESEGVHLDCDFSAKQYPPSEDDIAAGDTDHWYVMLEPDSPDGSPIADLILSLAPRDDGYTSTSELAKLLHKAVKGLNVTVLKRPGALNN